MAEFLYVFALSLLSLLEPDSSSDTGFSLGCDDEVSLSLSSSYSGTAPLGFTRKFMLSLRTLLG